MKARSDMEKFEKEYLRWLESDILSNEEKDELKKLDKDEIFERFYRDLEFGTGGLRGVMAMGTNRMNKYIIRKATQGLANYLLKNVKGDIKVAIGYDSRNNSKLFSKEASRVLASNGIKVYLYKELMPTPALSFAVRQLKCDAGIVVTASHNPKQYNGYKVYGNDGCQCTLDMANAIYEEIKAIDVFNDIKLCDFALLLDKKMIEYISDDVFEVYMKSTLKESLYKEDKKLKIIYTPLNGAGKKCITTILDRDGFKDVKVVKEQEMPNGDFPTCPYPNPEIHAALELGIKMLMEEKGDILIGSDPDSDRLGCVVNLGKDFIILTGNEVGLLLFDAIYQAKKDQFDKSRPVLVKTIVSTDMANIMAKDYDVEVREVLTGFKFIGEQIHLLEEKGEEKRFIFGFEESCGYLSNIDVRDKDAVNAALLLAECANHLKLQGKTLVDRLNELYAKYGDYKTALLTFEYAGASGQEKIKNIMKAFRDAKVQKEIANLEYYGDYLLGKIIYKDDEKPTGLPKSDVIKFFLKNGETITIRPSGTEPKLKAYIFAYGEKRVKELTDLVNSIIEKV